MLKFVPGFFSRTGASRQARQPAITLLREDLAVKLNIKEAVAHFKANQETIPVAAIRKGDYAFAIVPEDHLYLVVEKGGTGIFLARLGPDLLRLKPLTPEEEKEARAYANRRLTEAGLL